MRSDSRGAVMRTSHFLQIATPRQSRLSRNLRDGSTIHALGGFVGEDEGRISSCEQVFPRLRTGLRVIGEPHEPGRRVLRHSFRVRADFVTAVAPEAQSRLRAVGFRKLRASLTNSSSFDVIQLSRGRGRSRARLCSGAATSERPATPATIPGLTIRLQRRLEALLVEEVSFFRDNLGWTAPPVWEPEDDLIEEWRARIAEYDAGHAQIEARV